MNTKPLLLALLVLAVAGCEQVSEKQFIITDSDNASLWAVDDGDVVCVDGTFYLIGGDSLQIALMQSRISRLAADSARCANASTTRKYFDGALTCRWVLDTADFADTIRGNWVKYRNSSTKKIHLVGPQLWEIIRVRVDSIYVCDTARKGE